MLVRCSEVVAMLPHVIRSPSQWLRWVTGVGTRRQSERNTIIECLTASLEHVRVPCAGSSIKPRTTLTMYLFKD